MEAFFMCDAENHPGAPGGVDKLAALLDRPRQRLLAQNVLAAADGGSRNVSVRLGGCCDDEGIETWLREQFLQGRERRCREALERGSEAGRVRIANPDHA